MAVRFLGSVALALSIAILLWPQPLRAGGPRTIAGTSYFDPAVKGTPLTWSQGVVSYYTDRGNLSPLLPGASADAFVATAFSRWTSISTAAVSAIRAGQLAEDVSGANVSAAGGTVTLPADILPSATNFPLAVVYDADGSVTNALLGEGAGGADSCFSNAAYGGVDSFSSDAHLQHALVILNGVCAQTSAQLPDVEYRLVRVLGRVLGLDWSQMNLNVFTRSPAPTSADYAGLTIMHAMDPINCVPISICYPNADQPAMDDRAALSRLYPVTPQNQAAFPGKQLFSENRVRIHGAVSFADANGQPAQPMQGVNVVARWIDPSTGLPSRTFAASSVSGFLFRGNAGNAATGFDDSTGQLLSRFGSDDPATEGFFDLAGLEIPNAASSAQYQLSVEAIDPLWSQPVGPYGPWQVLPSGTFQPLIVTISEGGDLQQDIVMQASALQTKDWFEPTSFAAPAALPPSGDWAGTLSGSGKADYFWFVAQSNRSLSVEVTAVDDAQAASVGKAQPVIGMWALADTGTTPAPANTALAFNSTNLGMTRLDATLQLSTAFRVGILDYRGDGRPDYRYLGRVFYADTAIPARARVDGSTAITVRGVGFGSNVTATVAAVAAPVLAASANSVIVTAPAMADGIQNIGLRDAATGASSTMTNVLTYGAGPSDTIKLIQGSNPATPVGGQAPNPIRVQVLAPDGATPVAGASVFFISTPASSLSACGGAGSCTVLTDDSGEASTRVTVLQAAVINVSVLLAPASYQTPKSVQATILGTTSSLDLSLLSPSAWVEQGATVDITLSARMLSGGEPIRNGTVNYQVVKGSGTLASASAISDVNGFANTTLHLASIAGDVQVSACVAPANLPCQLFSATAVPPSMLRLEPVGGGVQILPTGQNFQPITVRVTDSANPTHPVLGAGVTFQVVVSRPATAPPPISLGGIVVSQNPAPVVVSSSQVAVLSDESGLATLQPPSSGVRGALIVQGTASAGSGLVPFQLQSLAPVAPSASSGLRGPAGSASESDRVQPAPSR
ncbi:MAG: IPT/TIG domain-containing protein [Terriglobales bacterium]